MRLPTDRDRWHQLSWLIGLVAASGRIVDSRPVSMLLIGPPGSGKSQMLERYHIPQTEGHNRMLAFASNVSTMGVESILREQVPRGVTHLVTPELQTLILRKSVVWLSFVGLMLQAMEDGVEDSWVGPRKKSYGGARLGLIAGIATDAWYSESEELTKRGFTSRMLVCRWDRTPENVLRSTLAENHNDRSEIEPIAINIVDRRRVAISERLANEIAHYAAQTDSTNQRRAAKRFVTLTKVVAALEDEEEAQAHHWAQLREVEWAWRVQT